MPLRFSVVRRLRAGRFQVLTTAIATAFQPETQSLGATAFDLGARQQGQVLVSCLWAAAGIGAMLFGLARGNREARMSGLGLLLVTVGKVFLFDLATLTAGYRVASFIGLGLLLLAGSFAWQRFRPKPLPDMREAPPALR